MMMKKILLVLVLLFVLTACSSSEPAGSLANFGDAYADAGHVVDLEEKPLYSFVGATDGFIFYLDREPVKVYEFDSVKDLEKSDFTFAATNGRFALETNSATAIEIFNGVVLS